MAGLLADSLTVVRFRRQCGGFQASGIVLADGRFSSTANTRPHFTCMRLMHLSMHAVAPHCAARRRHGVWHFGTA
jgi:hypothetical protein